MSFRSFIGALLLILGGGFLAEQMNLLDFSTFISTWWPLLIILFGIIQLLSRQAPPLGAAIVIAIGVLIQLTNLSILPGDFVDYFLPLLMILIGAWLIITRFTQHPGATAESDLLNYFTAFSGIKETISSSNFQGGSVVCLFGGADINLRHCTIDPKGATLDLNCAFGGIDLRVPDEWQVKISGIPLFGGWENKTQPASDITDSPPVLEVRCFIAFGGVDVTN
jgi:hypothetical protein